MTKQSGLQNWTGATRNTNLVTLNPFYLLDCYGSLMKRASFMICQDEMIPQQSYQTGECKLEKRPQPVTKCR